LWSVEQQTAGCASPFCAGPPRAHTQVRPYTPGQA
jgi:hypothetical protein